MSAESRVVELGLVLPDPFQPTASYVTLVRTGNLVYTSGHGPTRPEGGYVTGTVGADLTVDDGRAAARLAGLSLLATLRHHLGSLDAVRRVVKVLGMVNADPGFTEHPSVINGCSDLMIDVFGEAGRHARSAVGLASLPHGIPVEIELIAEVG